MTTDRHAKFIALLLGTASACAVLSSPAAAAEERQRFDIRSQDAAAALNEYARQAGVQIVFPYDRVRGKTAPEVQGDLTRHEALALLTDGMGLSVTSDTAGMVTLKDTQAPQGGSAAGGGAEVEALIVTAQKREEDIQDVPIAISAFTQEQLERTQIAGGPDLITQVPNMTFTKTNFSSYSIQLRGIGTQAISATTDPGVAVAFNNTPFIRNRFFEQEFYDLQRVEVLRGPQGTLYGRNATAGVVNIISQKPRFNFEAKASGDIANYSSTRLEGMINLPLVEDKVALRLAGAWTKREGYATNEITGNPIDGRDLWSTRVSLRFTPNDRIDANLIWEHFEENDDRIRSGKQLCSKHIATQVGSRPITYTGYIAEGGQGSYPAQALFSQGCIRESLYSPESFQTPNGLSVPYYLPLGYIGLPINAVSRPDPYLSQVQSRDLRIIESIAEPKYRAFADIGELQISWDVTDNLTLASETAYSSDEVWSTQDFNRFNTAEGLWNGEPGNVQWLRDAGILNENNEFCDPQIGCSSRLVAIDLSTGDSRQFSQELRLSSNFDGAFNFSLGANFLRFDGEDKYYVFINSLTLSRLGDLFGSFLTTPFGTIYRQWDPASSDNSECSSAGPFPGVPGGDFGYLCVYIENNPIEALEDQGHNYFLSKNPYRLISYAVFGEAYYNITDALKVTAGLRWTVDKKHAPRIPSWTLVGNTRDYPVMEIIDQEWREPTGRLTVDWKPDFTFTDETLLYASYAHGYKAGGANPPPMELVAAGRFGGIPASVTRPKTFDAEFIDAFELGAKNTLLDGRVTLNMAAFYYDYKDYQISEIVDRSAYNRNFDATIYGLELEADWRPLENLRFGLKLGYENTAIADGEQTIDLMDRTAGREGWVVVRPFPTQASSCVLPTYVFDRPGGLVSPGGQSGGNPGPCELTYLTGVDPVTQLPYVENPPANTVKVGSYPGYIGFDPIDGGVGGAHNFGEGFLKDIGGNPLPNAPDYTATLTVDYTLPLPNEWLATLHTDLYWQSESNWRVFDDHEYNKLDEYFTMNLAAIFTNEDAGWKVMAYVKNVFDRDSITGAFLNSDDTGLTTNVFLTEPRLYGLRVTKDWNGAAWWTGLGAGRPNGAPYPLALEVSGGVMRADAPYENVDPSFMDMFSEEAVPQGLFNNELDHGDTREVKLTYRPEGSAWLASAGFRYGRVNGGDARTYRLEEGEMVCGVVGYNARYCEPPYVDMLFFQGIANNAPNWSVASASNQERYDIAEFKVGRDVGLGGLGGSSTVALGLRYAQFNSKTFAEVEGANWYLPEGFLYALFDPAYNATATRYESDATADRSFDGTGPAISWDAAQPLLDAGDAGRVNLDWSVSAGALFGKQKTSIVGEESAIEWEGKYPAVAVAWADRFLDEPTITAVSVHRSDSATVPFVDLSLGLSYELQRIKVSTGYRWERYFDVLDGGNTEAKQFDRTIDGPFLKIAVGFGG